MSNAPLPITIVVLAAGQGQRFRAAGGQCHKLDAPFGDASVLECTMAHVRASGLAWHVVRPVGGTAGMGDSIALGVAATATAAGWLILPADMPLVQATTLRAVAQALHTGTASVVLPSYQGHPGHPVGFSNAHREALLRLRGDTGAKALVRAARAAGTLHTLPVPDSGIVIDVDTPHALAHALQHAPLKGACCDA